MPTKWLLRLFVNPLYQVQSPVLTGSLSLHAFPNNEDSKNRNMYSVWRNFPNRLEFSEEEIRQRSGEIVSTYYLLV